MNWNRMSTQTLLKKLEAAEFYMKMCVPSDAQKAYEKGLEVLAVLKKRGVELPSYIKVFHYELLDNNTTMEGYTMKAIQQWVTLHTYEDIAFTLHSSLLAELLDELEFGCDVNEFIDNYTWDDSQLILEALQQKGYLQLQLGGM